MRPYSSGLCTTREEVTRDIFPYQKEEEEGSAHLPAVLSHPRHRSLTYLLTAGCSGGRTLDPVRRCPLYMGYYLGEIFFDNCVNVNGAPRMRTPSRRSGAWSCHAPGGVAARGPPVGVLRSAAHRRAESRFWGVFIIAVHRAFVLGLGARHRGIVELSEDSCV